MHLQCYPNPAAGTLHIVFSTAENSMVKIGMYNIYSRLISEITDTAGVQEEKSISMDASGMIPGIYLLRMQAGDRIADSRMAIIH